MTDELDMEEEVTIAEFKSCYKAYIFWLILAALLALPVATIPASFVIVLIVWLSVRFNKYKVTTERLITTRGIIFRKMEEVELFRIKDVNVSQSVLGRILNYGTVRIEATDTTTPTLKIKGIDRPIEIKEQLRSLYRKSRKKERVVNTELIYS